MLDTNTSFREWRVTVAFKNVSFTNLFALPDAHARNFTWYEILGFSSEFFWRSHRFKAYLWDLELRREHESEWRRLNRWKVARQDDPPVNYGVRLVRDEGRQVIEMSNDGPARFLPKDTVFDLAVGNQ